MIRGCLEWSIQRTVVQNLRINDPCLDNMIDTYYKFTWRNSVNPSDALENPEKSNRC